mgnify:CR=1 FL=1
MEDKEIVLRRAKNAVISRDFNLAIRLYKSLLQEDVKNIEYLSALGYLKLTFLNSRLSNGFGFSVPEVTAGSYSKKSRKF